MVTELERFDEFLHKVSSEIKVFRFMPSNAVKLPLTENPQLIYPAEERANGLYRSVLTQMKIPAGDAVIRKILSAKYKDIVQKLALAQATGTADFTARSIALYGRPSRKLIERAYAILAKPSTKESGDYVPSYQIQEQLKAAFADMNISGWKVEKKDMFASASVDIRNRTFYIRKKERMLQRYVDRLKVHEIGVHVTRYENGLLQPLKVFSTGFPGSLTTEEGLAAYMEELAGLSSTSIQRQYAGRVIAVALALEHDFLTTHKKLCEYFSPQVALRLTLRAKRGLSDTSLPGGFTKDYLYLQGYYDVKKYAQKNDVRDLFIGKIGIGDVAIAKKIAGVVPAKHMVPLVLPQKMDLPNEVRSDQVEF